MSGAVGPSTEHGNIELAIPGGRSGHEAVSGGDRIAGETCLKEDPLMVASPQASCRQEHLMILNCEEADDQTAQGWQAWRAFDDVKGGELSPELVHGARVRELKYLMDRKVYEYSTCAEASRKTGR